jgi:hypothetical protein
MHSESAIDMNFPGLALSLTPPVLLHVLFGISVHKMIISFLGSFVLSG